ncbi:MAG TPA: extracellular solute-binding protein [Gemmatimonadales bacterium]|nr:extracellular solute-binding protein [Gemmatimonadales bacterium]
MKRALGVWLVCWGCAAPGPERRPLLLADRTDAAPAALEAQLLAPYLARHPDLDLVRRSSAALGDEYDRGLLLSLAHDDPPDAFLLDDEQFPRVADRGVALDLTPYLPRVGVTPSRFDPTVLALFRRGTDVYALPRGYTPVVVAYNQDLFDRAGIPYPTDDWAWDDFMRVAHQLTRATHGAGAINQWGSALDRRPTLFLPWIWAGGGDVLCADGRRATGCLDSRATIEALRWYTAWVAPGGIAPRITDGRAAPGAAVRLFNAGRLALLTTGHWAVPELRAAVMAGRLRVGFVAIPHRAGAAPATVLYASGYAVRAATARRKAAVELAAELSDSAAGLARGQAGLELPAVTQAAAELAAADPLGWEAAFLRAAAHGRPSWAARVAAWREVEGRLTDLIDRLVLTDADPSRAAQSAARELDRVLGATR